MILGTPVQTATLKHVQRTVITKEDAMTGNVSAILDFQAWTVDLEPVRTTVKPMDVVKMVFASVILDTQGLIVALKLALKTVTIMDCA